MADRREPLSSKEMLEQFRREVESQQAAREADRASPSSQDRRPARKRDRIPPPAGLDPTRRAARRPEPPAQRPPEPGAQRRAVIVAAISLALVVFGLISALLFAAQPG